MDKIIQEKTSGFEESFEEPAMNRWVTSSNLNRINFKIEKGKDDKWNLFNFLISIVFSIFATYFLSKENWVFMILMLIPIEIVLIIKFKKTNKYIKELGVMKRRGIKSAKQLGIPLPKNTK